MKTSKKYDFAGYVTKNDIKCLDGLTIRHGAFKDQDATTVPLVWQHDHNSPDNVIGHMQLENRDDGVYGYGFFNDTAMGKTSKDLVQHGDVNSLSIWANKLKKEAKDVVHGVIREVSLVLAGANPGAKIEFVNLAHDDSSESDEAFIYTDTLIHSADLAKEILDDNDEEIKMESDDEESEDNIEHAARTVGAVMSEMTEEQQNAVATLIDSLINEYENVEHSTEEENDLKTNLFNNDGEALSHDAMVEELQHSVFDTMRETGATLQEAIAENKEDIIAHGITNMEKLFPEAEYVGNKPYVYGDINTAEDKILAGVKKSPLSRLKNLIADFTAEEARARGYVKGSEKVDQIFELYGRETYPTTIYKKQSYDRDDVVDVTEIDLINFTKAEMRMMLNRELARAILVGDGRLSTDPYKIKEDKIRPIISDDALYTIKKEYTNVGTILEDVIKAMAEYRGSGMPSLYIQPELLAEFKLIKANDGRYLFGDIPSDAAMASRLGVKEIVPTTFFGTNAAFVIVNLGDYTVGANKGGEVTTFDDFDIDFNKLKYLIETRVSGSLMVPKSAIYFTKKA